MPSILIDDFSGGFNVSMDRSLIEKNECASGSINVWAPYGTLHVRPTVNTVATAAVASSTVAFAGVKFIALGTATSTAKTYDPYLGLLTFSFLTYSATGSGQTPRMYQHAYTFDVTGQTTYQLSHPLTTSQTCFLGRTDTTGGTIASIKIPFTTVNAVITGVNTDFTQYAAGDVLWYNNEDFMNITSIADATHMTVSRAMIALGASSSGSSYFVFPTPTVKKDKAGTAYYPSWSGDAFNNTYVFVEQSKGMFRVMENSSINPNILYIAPISAGPKAKILIKHKDNLFAFNISGSGSNMAWSALNDETTWPSTRAVTIGSDNQESISNAISVGNAILVIKKRSAFLVFGEHFEINVARVFSIVQLIVPNDFNVVESHTVSLREDGSVIIFGINGVYEYDGGNSIKRISQNIDKNLLSYRTNWLADDEEDYINYAASFKGIVMQSIAPTAIGNPDESYVLTGRKSFWRWNFPTSLKPPHGPAVINNILHFSNGNNGQLRKFDYDYVFATAQDLTSVNVNATWESKEFVVGYSNFKLVDVWYRKTSNSETFSFDWSVDQAAYTTNTVDSTVAKGSIGRKTFVNLGIGHSIQFRVNSISGKNFEIYRIECLHDPISTRIV